jgi:hypothetical protein
VQRSPRDEPFVPSLRPLAPFSFRGRIELTIICPMTTNKQSESTPPTPRLAIFTGLIDLSAAELGLAPSLASRRDLPCGGRVLAGLLVGMSAVCLAQGQDRGGAPLSSGTSAGAAYPPTVSSAGLLNDWLREESPAFEAWDIGGQVRGRFEYKDYFAVPNESAVDLARKGDSNNSYFLLRERLHLGYTPVSWLKLYGEVQDAGAYGDDRNPSPDNDHAMLRQAWAGLGDPKEFPLTLKAGRQELIYGDQRLVGTADWLNIGRVFDAVKLRYDSETFWVDAFVSQPVIPDRFEFDESDPHDRFSGLYASSRKLIPFQESQLYFLSHNVDEHSSTEQSDKLYPLASPRDIYTIGARVKSLPQALGGWDYEVEVAGQFGRFKYSNTSPSLSQRAFAVHAGGGYTCTNAPGSPRLGVEYNFASGDGNPNDNTHGTFDNLFPSNHGLYGIMDFFALQNMQDLHLAASIKPLPHLTVKLDGYAFWLADTHDYFYSANGAARKTGGYGLNPAAGSYVGSELDLVGNYAITSYASVQAGFGHFFSGDYPVASLAAHGGATDANYVFAQFYFNF